MTNTETVSTERLVKKLDALAAHFEAACHVGDAYLVEENAADAKTLRDASAAIRSLASRTQSPATDDRLVEAIADELVAHGEFSSIPSRNHGNAATAARAVLRIIRAASIPAPERSKEETGVRVKPLEWDENGDAKTALVTYHVEKGMFGWQWSCFSGAGGFAGPKPLGSEEAAKVAAQADYEQRVLSALETPTLQKEGEAVAWQARRETWPDGYWSNPTQLAHSPVVDFGEGWSTRLLYTLPAPVPLPVTITDEVAELQAALIAWVNVAEMLAGEPGMDAHFHDVADATLDVVTRARAALSQKPGEQG